MHFCHRLAVTHFIVTASLLSFVDAFVLPRDTATATAITNNNKNNKNNNNRFLGSTMATSTSVYRNFQSDFHHGKIRSVRDRCSGLNQFLGPLMMLPGDTATSSNSTSTTISEAITSSSADDEMMKHKLIVLEDVVERLQRQKSQLSVDLIRSQSLLEEAKKNLTAEIDEGREAVHEERRKHRSQINELKGQLESMDQEMQSLRKKNRENFERAKEKAMEEHSKLEGKANDLADQLATAQSKLDLYRKESYERETRIRQSLQNEQEARKKMEAARDQAIEEAEKLKTAMAKQTETMEETLMISEAAVAAADRREAALKNELGAREAKIAELQSQLNTVQSAASEGAPSKTDEVKELEKKIFLMHQNFEAERQRERQKWGREIEALQEALEIAKNSNQEVPPTVPSQQRSTKPGIIRRIQRKIRP